MLYLLDADTLITGDRRAYPVKRFPVFWEWLRHQGTIGNVKVPLEQYEEVTSGRGDIVDWLCTEESKAALILNEELDPGLVADTIMGGYGALDETASSWLAAIPFSSPMGVSSRANAPWSALRYRNRASRAPTARCLTSAGASGCRAARCSI